MWCPHCAFRERTLRDVERYGQQRRTQQGTYAMIGARTGWRKGNEPGDSCTYASEKRENHWLRTSQNGAFEFTSTAQLLRTSSLQNLVLRAVTAAGRARSMKLRTACRGYVELLTSMRAEINYNVKVEIEVEDDSHLPQPRLSPRMSLPLAPFRFQIERNATWDLCKIARRHKKNGTTWGRAKRNQVDLVVWRRRENCANETRLGTRSELLHF
ncbi:hypothetical protein SUNI508_07969 [Seiridium unicorne]|uniref:Uncharacterized protein n=1 Tax=Seiridium unicorne TaxID=138068 RepID=A0ABR2UW27_9PEZI